MRDQKPIIVFHVELETDVSADAIYAVLADLSTHRRWAGTRQPSKHFGLRSIDAPGGPATVGTTFTSTGTNMLGTAFHDSSVVVEAKPGERFGFDTDTRLDRPLSKPWIGRFEHRYVLNATAQGARLVYDAPAFARDYVPWMMKPGVRVLMRAYVNQILRKHLRNLVRVAAEQRAPVRGR